MSNVVKLKRGSGSDPSASDLVVGELAIRTDNGKIFTKKDNGSVAEISGGGGIDDGDKGDITVSNGGDTFTIDNGVVTSAKIADGTIVNADISGSAAIAGSKIQAAGLVNAGVMTAAQNNKLAGIEDNATADMTGSEILSTISGENIILGEISSTGNSSFAGNITISSSDGGVDAAPELDLYRISASPDDADYLGQIKFSGESDDGSKEIYAKITGKIGDASSGTEDGILEIAHRKAGQNNISARFTSTDLKLINGTGLEVAGNISCDGTIDGRDVASDGTKLDGIESGATADQTASDILSLLSNQNITTTGRLQAGTAGGSDSIFNSNLRIENTFPTIYLNDSDTDNDFYIRNSNGVFNIHDVQASVNRFTINSSGTAAFSGNLDVGAGIDVTGNISCTGTVDGRDLATDGSKLDGIESGATADQSNSEIKTAYEANSNTNAFTDALLSKLNGIAASATNVTNNNQLTNGAGYITATLTNEQVQDIVGGMVSGNTESGITVTYQDGDGTLDFVVGTLNQNTTGNAATATKLATARTIAGVSFDGSANISLNNNAITNGAGYLTSVTQGDIANGAVGQNQLASGAVITAKINDDAVTYAKIQNVSATNRILGRDSSGAGAIEEITPANLRTMLNVADGATNVTNNNQLTNGAGYITATLTNEQVQDIVGGMVSGNTESGITVTYQDSDGTLDFSVASQTDQNFTTTLKNKLDGIASGATNVTNNNQLTNGAGYITSADGGNAATLDSLDSTSFLRSDTGDSASGDITFDGGAGAATIGGNSDLRFSSGNWTGDSTKIQAHGNYLYFQGGSNGFVIRTNAGSNVWIIESGGHLRPNTDNDVNLGSASKRIAEGHFLDLTSRHIKADNGIVQTKQTIATSYSLTADFNAMSVDPTINNGVTVTVPSGATWAIV